LRCERLALLLVTVAACGQPLRGTVLSVSARPQAKLIIMPASEFEAEAGMTYLHDHVAEIERGPFDGVLVDVGVEGPEFATTNFTRAQFEPSVALLKSTPFSKLTENFQILKASWNNVDPFDDAAFAHVAANAGVTAEVTRDAGLRGLFFDVEQQDGPVWAFPRPTDTHTFAEYEDKAFQRGSEVMAAIVAAYPQVTVLMNVATSEVFRGVCVAVGEGLDQDAYRLLPAFIDGMFAARDQARAPAAIVDGFGASWGTRDPQTFQVFHDLIHGHWDDAVAHWRPGIISYRSPTGTTVWPEAPALTCPPSTQQKLTRELPAGFGLKLDLEEAKRGGFHFDPASFDQNYYTPTGLAAALFGALRTTDRYVWMRSVNIDWFGYGPGQPPPPAYLQAVIDARASVP
jgi:hypothetical protein